LIDIKKVPYLGFQDRALLDLRGLNLGWVGLTVKTTVNSDQICPIFQLDGFPDVNFGCLHQSLAIPPYLPV
jgi:hypothetical protein